MTKAGTEKQKVREESEETEIKEGRSKEETRKTRRMDMRGNIKTGRIEKKRTKENEKKQVLKQRRLIVDWLRGNKKNTENKKIEEMKEEPLEKINTIEEEIIQPKKAEERKRYSGRIEDREKYREEKGENWI